MASMDRSDCVNKACRALMRRPGVVNVAYGLVIEKGVLTGRPMLRVSMASDAWARGLGRAIPRRLHGIPIGVCPAADVRPFCSCPYRPGEKITRFTPSDSPASGSIACFLQRGSKKYVLTNHHVFFRSSDYFSQKRNEVIGSSDFQGAFDDDLPDEGSKALQLENADKVFQPSRSDCLGVECNNPLAIIMGMDSKNVRLALHQDGPRKYWVDAAVAEVQTGRSISNEIKGVGVINTTIRDLGAEPIEATPPKVNVSKRGFVTDLTKGAIRDFFHDVDVSGNTTRLFEFTIVPTNDSELNYDETFTIDDSEQRTNQEIKSILEDGSVTVDIVNAANPRKIHVHGRIFSNRGDSGSLIVDDGKKPVGLLWGGNGIDLKVKGEERPVFVPSGVAIACYIKPVLDALDFKTNPIVAGTVNARGPGLPPPEPDQWDRFEDAQRRLEASRRGRELIAAIRAHAEEMRDLVLRGGRVSAVWRGYRGPGFVAAALAAARDPARTLVAEIEGISAETFVAKMHRAIMSEASEGLRSTIEHQVDFIFEVVRQAQTFSDVLQLVEQPIVRAAE